MQKSFTLGLLLFWVLVPTLCAQSHWDKRRLETLRMWTMQDLDFELAIFLDDMDVEVLSMGGARNQAEFRAQQNAVHRASRLPLPVHLWEVE